MSPDNVVQPEMGTHRRVRNRRRKPLHNNIMYMSHNKHLLLITNQKGMASGNPCRCGIGNQRHVIGRLLAVRLMCQKNIGS